jgi:hypothetical protein
VIGERREERREMDGRRDKGGGRERGGTYN